MNSYQKPSGSQRRGGHKGGLPEWCSDTKGALPKNSLEALKGNRKGHIPFGSMTGGASV
jgi:hypothetical protein